MVRARIIMRARFFMTFVTKDSLRKRLVEGKLKTSGLNCGDSLFVTKDNSVVWSYIPCRTYPFSIVVDGVNF